MTDRDPARGGLLKTDSGKYEGGITTSLANGLYVLIWPDGDFIVPIREAKDKIERGQHTLWNRIGPLEFHDVEVRHGSKFFHTGREVHLRAESVNLDAEGYPWVTFKVVDSWPHEFIEYDGEQLAERIAMGVLKTPQQVHEDVEAELGVEF